MEFLYLDLELMNEQTNGRTNEGAINFLAAERCIFLLFYPNDNDAERCIISMK